MFPITKNMRTVKVIKSYTNRPVMEVSFKDDLAVTEFRSFHTVASLHCERVSAEWARETLIEVLDDLKRILLAQNSNIG